MLYPHHGSAARARPHEGEVVAAKAIGIGAVGAISSSVATPGGGGTMSRGNVGGRSARIEMITWMRNVKEVKENRRDETMSSGEGNGGGSGVDGENSANGSRFSSRSRDGSAGEHPGPGRRSDSRSRGEEGSSQSLLAE